MDLEGDELLDFDPVWAVEEIVRRGAVAVPLLPEGLRRRLLAAAMTLTFVPAKPYSGKRRVRQNVGVTRVLPPEGFLQDFREVLTFHLTRTFTPCWPFTGRIEFNEYMAQCYPPSDLGLGVHRDYMIDRNVIVIVVLGGQGEFCLCQDESGDNPHVLDAPPGSAILLRAPGFNGGDIRPWHFVRRILTDRYILTLRQIAR